MVHIKRALISVSDKTGLLPFAEGLRLLGVEILSTGGTACQLQKAGIAVKEVSDYTGFPEMLDGRVKTLHPKIHGGLLALRENKDHMQKVKKYHIGLIDMVVVNLYPFERVTSQKNVSLQEVIENIDIGGPSMLRSAAKNFKSVAVISDPRRYEAILKELKNNSGILSDFVLFQLSVEAFKHTAEYDTIISAFLSKRIGRNEFSALPDDFSFKFSRKSDLRYGENPHQSAAFYADQGSSRGLAGLKQLHGKELSFNNILDLNAAVDFVKDFKKPAAVVIKHNNPTGLAQDNVLSKAYLQAWNCDKMSAFGGIIGLNKKVDLKTAELISRSGFMECVVAPGFQVAALKVLTKKKSVRLIVVDFTKLPCGGFDFKKVYGGLLVQDKDEQILSAKALKVATRKKPTKAQMESMLFGWQMIKNVKSNAIVLVKGQKTIGIGCGQTSRVESINIAVQKAGDQVKGSVLISDAFLPHVDNIHLTQKAGIKAIIQTGGSIADADVIQAADKAGIAMVMTGVRHFKH